VVSGGFSYLLDVFAGGRSISTTLSGTNAGSDSSAGVEDVNGTASGTAVCNGGQQLVESGGMAIGTKMNGGSEVVFAGGTAIGTTVNYIKFGEGEDVGGGTATGTIVNSGGFESVYYGGTAISTTVNRGRTLSRLGQR
jgi:autotransporter passenger strand-loop-strand repeat protein